MCDTSVFVLYEQQFYPPVVEILGVFEEEEDALRYASLLIGNENVVRELKTQGSIGTSWKEWRIQKSTLIRN